MSPTAELVIILGAIFLNQGDVARVDTLKRPFADFNRALDREIQYTP
jgi:hypothetical protein